MNWILLSEQVNIGGHPISLNDINHLQLGQFDISEAIGSQHTENMTNCILSGFYITKTATTFSMTQTGHLVYNRKLYQIASVSNVALSTTTGAKFKFQINTTYGNDNPVTYENGSQHNVHVVETVALVHTDLTGPDYIEIETLNLVSDWIDGEPVAALGSGIDTTAGGWDFRFRMISQNTMVAYLRIDAIAQAGDKNVTLPFPWVLKNTTHVIAHGLHDGANDPRMIVLKGIANSNILELVDTTETALPTSGNLKVKGAYFNMEVYFDPHVI